MCLVVCMHTTSVCTLCLPCGVHAPHCGVCTLCAVLCACSSLWCVHTACLGVCTQVCTMHACVGCVGCVYECVCMLLECVHAAGVSDCSSCVYLGGFLHGMSATDFFSAPKRNGRVHDITGCLPFFSLAQTDLPRARKCILKFGLGF